MSTNLKGRNRPCPWMDGREEATPPWSVELAHRDGSVVRIDDDNLRGDHIRMRNAQDLQRTYADSDLGQRLAALPESDYERYAHAIRAWFGYGELAGTEHFPPATHRPARHPERFPLLSAVELARGSWSWDVREHIDPRSTFTDFHLRWGLSSRDYDLAGLRRAVETGSVTGATLRRTQEEIRWLEAGYWPPALIRPEVGPGTYRLGGDAGLAILARPFPGAPVNGRVKTGDLVNHGRELSGNYVRLTSHLGWLAFAWLHPVEGEPPAA